MKSKLSAIVICLILFFATDAFAQKRYGLIFGTNYTSNKAGIPELNLCEADASYLNDEIRKVGNFDEVKVVLGKEVTKDNIEKEIKALAKKRVITIPFCFIFPDTVLFKETRLQKMG